MFQMLGVFAEFERSMIRERVMAGLSRAKADGIQLGRRRRGGDCLLLSDRRHLYTGPCQESYPFRRPVPSFVPLSGSRNSRKNHISETVSDAPLWGPKSRKVSDCVYLSCRPVHSIGRSLTNA